MHKKTHSKQPKTSNKNLYKWLVVAVILILIISIVGLMFRYLLDESTDSVISYSINTPGCAIPALAITNSDIAKYIFKPKSFKCDKHKALMASNLTSIYIQHKEFKKYNLNLENVKCCYQYFKRKAPYYGETDNLVKFHPKTCVEFTNELNVNENEDFVKVMCTQSKKLIYKDYFHFIPTKQKFNQNINKNVNEDQLNVLIFGIDSVSRINLHRQMPKTVQYLNQLQAVEMLGYNKIADNTFPNLIVVLTGHSKEEMQDLHWEKHGKSYFDEWEFIWKKFKAKQYITAFAEDSSHLGLFTYTRSGFLIQPTDYYYNHFDKVANNDIGYSFCIGSQPSYKILLQYTHNFVMKMRNTRQNYFGFFWTSSLTHDYFNHPSLGDDDVQNFLKFLKVSGVLNNTALIFMSDHGLRFGAFRNTYQGGLEDRLPFVFVVLPQWYKDKYQHAWNNLNVNKRRLTTPYDLYETLVDLCDVTLQNNYSNLLEKQPRGISLFKPISSMRTCKDAGIDPHWCTCQQSSAMQLNDKKVVKAVTHTVEHINKLLMNYTKCYPLQLDAILDGRDISGVGTKEFDKTRGEWASEEEYLLVTFKTKPSKAIFEATVKLTTFVDKNHGVDYVYEVPGAISRVNSYGTQSKCVQDVYIKLFCFCK